MIFWSAQCPECGVKESSNKQMTAREAKKWANEWEKKHWEVCSERSTEQATSEAGSQP